MIIPGSTLVMKVFLRNQQRSKQLNQQRIKRDLKKALSLIGFQSAELSVVFVGSRKIRLLNAHYRGIDRVTDVLSFPQQHRAEIQTCRKKLARSLKTGNRQGLRYSDPIILGDIVICIPVALRQAEDRHIPFYNHLLHLLIHGLLHLLGHDHEKNDHEIQKMHKKERELLNAIKTMA